MLQLDQIDQWRKRYNNTGIYQTAYRYQDPTPGGGKGQSIWGDLYIDLDSTDFEAVRQDALKCYTIFQALFGIMPTVVQAYFSGKKGLHLIVPATVLGITPHPDLNMVFQAVAKDLDKLTVNNTIDLQIYDRKRLFRLPNSIHQQTHRYKIPLSYDEIKSATYQEILDIASTDRPCVWQKPCYNAQAHRMWQDYLSQWEREKSLRNRSRQNGKQTLDYTPPCVRYLILNTCPDGKRNQTAAVLTNHYRQKGYSETEAYERLTRWNQTRVSPPLTERELDTIIHSIYRNEYQYGCSSLQKLAPCHSDKCRLFKRR